MLVALNTLLGLSFVGFCLQPHLYITIGSWRGSPKRRGRTVDRQIKAYRDFMYKTTLRNLQAHTQLTSVMPTPKPYGEQPYRPTIPPRRGSIDDANWFLVEPRPSPIVSQERAERDHTPGFFNDFFKAKKDFPNKSTAEQFYASEIVDSRAINGVLQYRVRWQGYTEANDTWEPSSSLDSARELIRAYHRRQETLPDDEIATTTEEGKPMYFVEEILGDRRREDGKTEYLVRWEGYSAEHDTWEPDYNLGPAQSLVDAYNWRKVNKATSAEDTSTSYYVEDVIGHRIIDNSVFYLVRWEGYPDSENTWEPLENLITDYDWLVNQYHERLTSVKAGDRFIPRAILGEKTVNGSLHYLVRWLGCPDSENTWEPAMNLRHFKHLLKKKEETPPDDQDLNVFRTALAITGHRGAGDELEYSCRWADGQTTTWEKGTFVATQEWDRLHDYLTRDLEKQPEVAEAQVRALVAGIIDHRTDGKLNNEFQVLWKGAKPPGVWLSEIESWPLLPLIRERYRKRPSEIPGKASENWTPRQGHPAGTKKYPTTFVMEKEVPLGAPYWKQPCLLKNCRYTAKQYAEAKKFIEQVRKPSPTRSIRRDGIRRRPKDGGRSKSFLLSTQNNQEYSDSKTVDIIQRNGTSVTMVGARVRYWQARDEPILGYDWTSLPIQELEASGSTPEEAVAEITNVVSRPLWRFLKGKPLYYYQN